METPIDDQKEIDDIHNVSEEESEDNLKIDIDLSEVSPKKCVTSTPKPDDCEQMIIESIEDELEKQLTEKAAKTKLNANHVKNIIKHVVTNEHVLALIRQAENPAEAVTIYEPKLTRSKAKELLKCNTPIPAVPWAQTIPEPPSETHVLVGEDLQEDSSGDEYVPAEEESEDEKESSVASESENLSLPPPTPPTPIMTEDSSTQTNWTEDGVFKIPPVKPQNEEANIALRTRSKINLSSTPLEVIETSFVPPDVTIDMYDMECDDEDWTEFLKGFMQPIDQIIKGTEDEDHDPEYNIMADEVSKIDKAELKEELRVDKAVKVSKKELNMLWEELFEFAEMYTSGQDKIEKPKKQFDGSICSANETTIASDYNIENNSMLETTDSSQVSEANEQCGIQKSQVVDNKEHMNETYILKSQVGLVQYQMRQHVQILVQNFLLTYQHPEFHNYSFQQKEYLMNLKLLGQDKKMSTFWPVNLQAALTLIDTWENCLAKNNENTQQHKLHVNSVLAETLQQKNSGNFSYIPTFSKLFLEVASKSEAFVYPSLLPKIPYKPANFFSNKLHTFVDSEDALLAVGLEQFTPLARENKRNILSNGDVKLKAVCSYIQEYMMPHKSESQIFNRISSLRQRRCANNPVKYYYHKKQAQPVIHYLPIITPVLAPYQQPPQSLPQLWRDFIYPPSQLFTNNQHSSISTRLNTIPVVLSTLQPLTIQAGIQPNYQVHFKKSPRSAVLNTLPTISGGSKLKNKPSIKKRTFLKSSIHCSQTPIQNFVECLKRLSPVEKLTQLFSNSYTVETDLEKSNKMLPSMPSLQTPIKSYTENETEKELLNNYEETVNASKQVDAPIQSNENPNMEKKFVEAQCDQSDKLSDVNSWVNTAEIANVDSKDEVLKQFGKDDPAAINKLMIASPAVKPASKKEPSGAEKKRAKIRREFIANLAVATPEDSVEEQHKSERFAYAYYDKLRETLELEDYHKVMQILNDYRSGDAVDLYRLMDQVLRPKYEELAEEFLLFLKEREAARVGRLMPWIRMNARSRFLRKLEIYFKDQPAQLNKIYKSLTELSQTVDISMEKIKSTLLPMLKGNAILVDLFLQNFLNERPPPSLLEGPYETVDFNKEMGRTANEELFENISVPDVEDRYGSFSCICSCHKIEDPEFKSKSRHCIPCGTRFIQGKVYIQTGRGPKPATVSFLTGKHTDHNVRLLGKTARNTHRKKRSDQSPLKHVTTVCSPSKENGDDDTEEEIDNKKKTKRRSKSPKKRKKQLDKIDGSQESKKDIYNLSISKGSLLHNCDSIESGNLLKNCKSRKRTYSMRRSKIDDLMKVEKVDLEGEIEEEFSEKMENSYREQHSYEPEHIECDLNGSGESTEKPSSPGAQTADSESEFCEESSQDNCESDSSSTVSSASNTNSQSDTNTEEWKKEEDKIILETFQQENDKEYAFKIISKKLTNRTIREIRNRFSTLMALLLEQIGRN